MIICCFVASLEWEREVNKSPHNKPQTAEFESQTKTSSYRSRQNFFFHRFPSRAVEERGRIGFKIIDNDAHAIEPANESLEKLFEMSKALAPISTTY